MPILVLAAIAAQLFYDFAFLPWRDLLVSDMGYFWERALRHLGGDERSVSQWFVWPVLPHIAMSWVIRLADAVGLSSYRLEFYLVLVAILHGSCVYAIYRAAERLYYKRHDAALMAAALYGFFPPLIHLNGHVLSEGFAQPLLVWSVCMLIYRPLHWWMVALSGAIFGISAAMRPAYGLFGLVLAAIIAVRVSDWKLWLPRAVALGAGFLVPILANAAYLHHVSEGRMSGIGGNGALVFFMHQCRPGGWAIVNPMLLPRGEGFNDCALYRRIHPPLERSLWVKTSMKELKACNGRVYGQPPALMEFADRPFLVTPHMPWNKDFFFGLGLECFKQRGLVRQLAGDFWQTRKLFMFFFPDQVFDDGKKGIRFGFVLKLILASNALFFLCGLMLAWWFKLKGGGRVSPLLLVLTGIPALAYLTSMFFAIDGRYLVPSVISACLAFPLFRKSELEI